VPLQPAHRPQSRLQPTVIRLDRVVRIPRSDVQCRGHQLIQNPRVNGRAVGRDLRRDRVHPQCRGEEPPRGRQVTPRWHEDIDDLPLLIYEADPSLAWTERVKVLAHRLRATLEDHPGVADLLKTRDCACRESHPRL
jgi:hypothetical protein